MITPTLRLILLGSAGLAGLLGSNPSKPPRVTINTGTLEGLDTGGVMVFRGIPYAAPPVGELRWKPPQPAKPWRGVRPAQQLAHNCIQHQPYSDIDPFKAGVSEDCLYLNVWTKSLPRPASRAPLPASRPVLVWLHGGGFFAGFGGEERHNGARLAQKGAVVVTLNYRLGAFGFLAHPALAAESPHHAAGNYGLLDQIAALQWVKRNIARFGGDPSRVTIFGESAGGMSVGALIASPLANGLFQRAILESGTGVGIGITPRDSAQSIGLKYAESVGVRGADANAARLLRAINADTLLAASVSGGQSGSPRFFPAVDGWVLPHPVDSALLRGEANLVPVIAGSNRDEGDEWMGAPTRSFARLLSARGVPTYVYMFSRVGDDSANRKRGAYHSAEITFVFGRPHPLQPSAGATAYDSTVAEAMSDYWVAFATSGDPNGPPTAGKWPRWPRYDASTDALLEIGPEIAARTLVKRVVYDSLDALARSRGSLRPGLVVAQQTAPAGPDLTGTWVLNRAKSDFGTMPPPTVDSNVVTRVGTMYEIATTSDFGGQGTRHVVLKWPVGEGEATNDLDGGATMHVTTKVQGDTATFSSTVSVQGRAVALQSGRVYLSPDRKTLTREIDIQPLAGPSTEPLHFRFVYDRK